MNKVKSYDQFAALIKDFKKGRKKIFTNFYFLPRDMKDIINNRIIQYQINKESLVFSIEEGDYSHIYYFTMDGVIPVIENTGKVMVLDMVARDKENIDIGYWKTVGFELYKLYVRMKYDLIKINDKRYNTIFDISCAQACDSKEILNIWRECLDCYSAPLPKEIEMEHLVNTNHVYCIRKSENIIGAVYMDVASKTCILKHLAICKAYRKQGFGRNLIDYALKRVALEGIKMCSLWVDIDNIPAYKSYKKYGFEEERLWSKQLIWRKNDKDI